MHVRTAKILFVSNCANALFTVVVGVYELLARSVFNNLQAESFVLLPN